MFILPKLAYAYDALEPHIDGQTMSIHHGKHHAAYISNLNTALEGHDDLLSMDINELVKNLDKIPENIRTAVRNNGGGHVNHSLFWTLMNPQGGGEAEGDVAKAINKKFGSFDSFKEEFQKAGLARFGSGWIWLIKNDDDLEITSTPNQDSPLMEGKIPILGCDVWEHAYYLKYQNRRADYLQAWWNIVDWNRVTELFIG
ncbi:superoxide dismutase [Candidatus Roizmanbacteria bacterium RIFCSPLOWO2_01_FULL_38_11]|uniref:Superoxide dismutase n=1 Tax=Candidatus Roizmanbacteria bacterium RIFCSPLOWO2_01_FULL_38_11 TaxID=1802060 RepID=A0A1F7IPI8_9BACT|nr:MAG: superoxide dismutase [Candidatus Roizmanbacteria bacterium RIFCSPLOWO2_01_FULL_38_11]